MKAVILAGGLGTRLAEETDTVPKPMVEVGGHPLVWHIMKHYEQHGVSEFVVALGYKGEAIKRFFFDYLTLGGDMSLSFRDGSIKPRDTQHEGWRVDLIETGRETNTGGRVGRLRHLLGGQPFLLTYGDGVADVDIGKLLAFHEDSGKLATITAVRPPSRFGELSFGEGDQVSFTEKPQMHDGWINGGFMVLEPEVLDLIDGDDSSLEKHVLERLSAEGQLVAYRHEQFWQCVDTLRDLRYMRSLWDDGSRPWVTWQ